MASQFGTPTFLTDQRGIQGRLNCFKAAFTFSSKIFYALKANYSPSILKVLKNAGVDGVDTVSPYEIALAKKIGFQSSQIIFTGSGCSDEELKKIKSEDVLCNLGSISELQRFGLLFPNSDISLRFNPGVGDGENQNVTTGGQQSKFGILQKDFAEAKQLIEKFGLKLIGLHCHIGSGFYKTEHFQSAVQNILQRAREFKNLQFIDLGGGFGVRFHQETIPVNLPAFGKSIEQDVKDFEKQNGKPIEIRFEPGKFLVAESTCLLTRVTTRKKTDQKDFVCVDTGMNHLIRPALYHSYHEVVNVSRPDETRKLVTIVGNICESTDVFADGVDLANPQEGDVLAILSAGAYGSSMSSLYNLRPYANEVMVDGSNIQLSRKKPDFETLYSGLGFIDG